MAQHVLLLATTVALCLSVFPAGSNGANILGFFPVTSRSHSLIHCAVANTLAEAGHNVTVVSTIPNLYKTAKYRFIQIDMPGFNPAFVSQMVNKPQPMYRMFGVLMGHLNKSGNETLLHPKVQKFMREHKNSFDLLILGYFWNDLLLGLGAHFNCPVILSTTIQPNFAVSSKMGNPVEMSYVPTLFSDLKQPLLFWDRVKNYFAYIFEEHIMAWKLQQSTQKFYEYHFPADRYPSLDDMRRNISLMFTNHHFSQGPIRPLVPGIIEIGGIQIKEKTAPLPADIAQVLDKAKTGVIYFSLGSNVQGSNLSKEKTRLLFNVLSKLPYTVLWKWDDSETPGTSENIVYKSWMPQDDVLAHPNVKLFITHGGLGSVAESQYHGVPLVGIPLFGDQPSNMVGVETAGFGRSLEYLSLTEENFEAAILEVIGNPKYTKAVQKFSNLYRDRPMTPRQLVVFWTEYVLRHKGAPHLQSPAVHMNSWQLMSLDVIGFLVAVVAIVLGLLLKLCKLICCRGNKLQKSGEQIGKSKKNK